MHSAGLVNMTGSISVEDRANRGELISPTKPLVSGAISYVSESERKDKNDHLECAFSSPNRQEDAVVVLNIDASKSSTIYGSSNTVQPASLEVKFCIKY